MHACHVEDGTFNKIVCGCAFAWPVVSLPTESGVLGIIVSGMMCDEQVVPRRARCARLHKPYSHVGSNRVRVVVMSTERGVFKRNNESPDSAAWPIIKAEAEKKQCPCRDCRRHPERREPERDSRNGVLCRRAGSEVRRSGANERTTHHLSFTALSPQKAPDAPNRARRQGLVNLSSRCERG